MGKRPCRICRRWFIPHPRLGERQRTCGDSHCQKEWHRKRCADWNRQNAEYFRTNYLQKKLDGLPPKDATGVHLVHSRFSSGLPLGKVQEVIGVQHFVIIEYLVQLLFRRFQELIRAKVAVNTG